MEPIRLRVCLSDMIEFTRKQKIACYRSIYESSFDWKLNYSKKYQWVFMFEINLTQHFDNNNWKNKFQMEEMASITRHSDWNVCGVVHLVALQWEMKCDSSKFMAIFINFCTFLPRIGMTNSSGATANEPAFFANSYTVQTFTWNEFTCNAFLSFVGAF